jgi:hypothetical protein
MPKKGERIVEYVTVTCPCGKEFTVTKKRHADGRGRYCSRQCRDRLQPRAPRGRYNVKVQNRGWFKPGQAAAGTPFKRGRETWNKGRPTGVVPPNAFKPGETAGEANARWAGDAVGYGGLHARAYGKHGKASDHACAHADETCKGPMNWANISGAYLDADDFMPLCQSHHVRYDNARRLKSKEFCSLGRPGSPAAMRSGTS